MVYTTHNTQEGNTQTRGNTQQHTQTHTRAIHMGATHTDTQQHTDIEAQAETDKKTQKQGGTACWVSEAVLMSS